MSGVSGTSRTGVTHRYYHCHTAKKMKACHKKRIGKAFVEQIVVDYILNMLDNMLIVDHIVDGCYERQMRKSTALPALESQLTQTEKAIDNVMKAIKQGIITATTKETL